MKANTKSTNRTKYIYQVYGKVSSIFLREDRSFNINVETMRWLLKKCNSLNEQ